MSEDDEWPTARPRTARRRRASQAVSMRGTLRAVLVATALATTVAAQGISTAATTVIRPARVFDGATVHEGWAVRVKGDRIDAVGPAATVERPRARRSSSLPAPPSRPA